MQRRGRLSQHLTRKTTERGAIGGDRCQTSMGRASRGEAANVLFVVADARASPEELRQVASRVTINVPWGSLLRGLVHGRDCLCKGL
jgi:hypothetical protein